MYIKIPKFALDLFCGCGGISAGLEMSGFEVVAGLDVDKKYIASFKKNFPKATAITESIVNCSPEVFCSTYNIDPGSLGILVGGPPCQGFSKNVPRQHRFLEDPKNELVNSFLDYAIYMNPPLVIMENVAEMKKGFNGHYANEIIERLSSAGYSVTPCVINAADFGIPQRRRRAFFIANNLGIQFAPPKPTHFRPLASEQSLFDDHHHINVWDAISDLPSLSNGEGREHAQYADIPMSQYQRQMRSTTGYVENHIARKLSPKQFERISSLEPGQGMRDLPAHLQTKGGYSGAYGRLTKEMIAPTITRWVFHPGSGRWGHPVDKRILTIREVARIQGFLDSFEFVGSYNDQAGQLGNAVPPLLINRILSDLRGQLQYQVSFNKSAKCSNDIFWDSVGELNVMA